MFKNKRSRPTLPLRRRRRPPAAPSSSTARSTTTPAVASAFSSNDLSTSSNFSAPSLPECTLTKKAYLFTGKIHPSTLDILIEQTKNITEKFASIWENENSEYIIKLRNNNFKIIYNDIKEQGLYKSQFITIFNGLNYLKDNGYEYVLKTRLDIISEDYEKYLKLIINLYPERITCISGIQTDTIYFLDIIISGRIDNMCKFCALQFNSDDRYPEKFLIENYSNKNNLTRNEIREILNFSLDICIANNIEFIWYRPSGWLSTKMRVIKDYCTSDFIFV